MAYDDIVFIGFFLANKNHSGGPHCRNYPDIWEPKYNELDRKSDKKLMVNIAAVGSAKCSPKSKKRGGHASESESH